MTVAELMNRLENCDPDATVRITMQESWPLENSILGTAQNSDFASAKMTAEVGRRRGLARHRRRVRDPELAGNEAFIVEGTHERYGSKAARDVCR